MQHFQFLCMSPLLPAWYITICTTVRKIFYISLVVKLLIYSKKNVFSFSRIKTIHVFNMHSTISQCTIVRSLIGFNIALTNVEARLKQRCINVLPTLYNIVSTLWNFVLKLFQRRALTFYQLCTTFKTRCRILFHFQRRINVISTLIHTVETTLIRRWNGGWDTSIFLIDALVLFLMAFFVYPFNSVHIVLYAAYVLLIVSSLVLSTLSCIHLIMALAKLNTLTLIIPFLDVFWVYQ